MKKVVLSLMLVFGIISLFGQNSKYTKAMEKALAKMNAASQIESIQNAANQFERIANVEKKEWLPTYYQALCHMWMATKAVQKMI